MHRYGSGFFDQGFSPKQGVMSVQGFLAIALVLARTLLYDRVAFAHQLGQLLREDIQDRGFRPDLICGPAIGGVIWCPICGFGS